MHTHRTPDVALWDRYRALPEQWTHEDNLIAQRMGWSMPFVFGAMWLLALLGRLQD